MSRTLTLTSPAMPTLLGLPALEARAIHGHETLGEMYHYTVLAATPDSPLLTERAAANVDFKSLVGKEATVHIQLDGKGQASLGQGERQISGLVTRARFVALENRRALYELQLEPWLALAARSADYRIFQDMSALDIVQAVLGGYSGGIQTAAKPGYPYPLVNRTCRSYPKKDYVVQYGETDLAFVSRIMEEWGMYYYFEHQNSAHRMILADDQGSHAPQLSAAHQILTYYPPGHYIDEEYLNHVDFSETLETGVWVSSDFDFKQPRARLEQRSVLPRNTGHNQLEYYSWPNDSYDPHTPADPSQGQRLAEVRLQTAGSLGQQGAMGGHLRGVACGYTFTLNGYPSDAYNQKDYLVVSSHLNVQDSGGATGEAPAQAHAAFTVIPTQHTYRPARRAPIPKTTGPQTAIVTGPAGREIHTDQYGRVKLSFHWNRYCTHDENSSCWVRVNHPWAGPQFGGIQLPRIGQEVIVDFENGDPDRPIVIGRVYNALNMPPWSLPENQTQSGFLTRSSEGGGAQHANALRFEDKKGAEEIWLHAEKDQRIEVENDESHWVGHDRSKTVDHDETTHIKNDRRETVDGHETITVHKTRTETVDQDETLTLQQNRSKTVGQNETVHIGANQTVTIGQNRVETITMGHMQTVMLGKMVNVLGAFDTNVGLARVDMVGLDWTQKVGKDRSTQIRSDDSLEVGQNRNVQIGDALHEEIGGERVVKVGTDSLLRTGGEIAQEAGSRVAINAPEIVLSAGQRIRLQCGASVIELSPGQITLNAPLIKINS